MSKHTAGPWKKAYRNVNEIMTTFHGVMIGNVFVDIATCNDEADARLIAAAPELLEALEEARLTLEVVQGRGSSVKLTLDIIDRAIAKATGEAQ